MSDHSDLVGEPCPPDRCRDRTDPRACMCAKAAAALTARAEEIERLTAERKLLAGQREAQTAAMTWLKGAHDGSNAEIARLRAAVTALVEAAGPFVRYSQTLDRQNAADLPPDNEAWHGSLTHGDLRALARAALSDKVDDAV